MAISNSYDLCTDVDLSIDGNGVVWGRTAACSILFLWGYLGISILGWSEAFVSAMHSDGGDTGISWSRDGKGASTTCRVAFVAGAISRFCKGRGASAANSGETWDGAGAIVSPLHRSVSQAQRLLPFEDGVDACIPTLYSDDDTAGARRASGGASCGLTVLLGIGAIEGNGTTEGC